VLHLLKDLVLFFSTHEVILHIHVRSPHFLIKDSLDVALVHEPLDSIVNLLDVLFNIYKETIKLELDLI